MPIGDKPGLYRAPEGIAQADAAVRAHELGHLALQASGFLDYKEVFGAAETAFIPEMFLQAGLDVLVNARFSEETQGLPFESNPKALAKLTDKELAAHALHISMGDMGHHYTKSKDGKKVVGVVGKRLGDETVSRLEAITGTLQILACKKRLDLAKFISQLSFFAEPPPPDPEEQAQKFTQPDESGDRWRIKSGDSPWGDLVVINPPKEQDVYKRLGMRRWKGSFVGAFRRPSRIPTDMRCWSIKKPVIGKSILIDTSGSMSLSYDEIWTMLKANPGATIGAYRGYSNSGCLIILAKDGYVVSRKTMSEELDKWTPGNVVDGPGLEWLEQQAAPRVWLSDGEVTGKDERRSPGLLAEVRAICERADIVRIGTVQAYCESIGYEERHETTD